MELSNDDAATKRTDDATIEDDDVIVREPGDQFYGDRTYTARDPEGHVWTFGQTVRVVSREEAEKASGLKVDGWF